MPLTAQSQASALVAPTSREFRDAPLERRLDHLAQLREAPGFPLFDEPSVPGLPLGVGYRAVARHADVIKAIRRPAAFRSGQGSLFINDLPTGFGELLGSIITMDDPGHRRLRAIVAQTFTRQNLRTLRSQIDQAAADTVNAVATRREFDIVTDLAAPFSLLVIAGMLGIPDSQHARVLEASTLIASAGAPNLLPGEPDPVRAVLDAGTYLANLATDLAAFRRTHPTGDLLTTLTHAQIDGRPLADSEIASFFTLLTFAGQETTRNTISLGLWALHTQPDARTTWAADFDRLAPTAVEELIRYTSPVVLMRRTTTHDTTLAGHPLKAGEKIALCFTAANHDPNLFTQPDRLNLTRTPNPHLGFGGPGPHHCLGAHLARAEISALFRETFHHLPDLTITGEPQCLQSITVNALTHLPASTTPNPP
ncbi:cytochrome P450 [Frankia sp. AgB1.9]|uniref:cytochrome P450 n=1 Tax=unclassified Frankia TaxID=2632575 RepID=UPI001933E4E4|nr:MULTISPECIES: cytochrome P450 [unclassified Frankia]MBL7494033.1 cytochrome P450 [Frankia sp. AgW1.1]MBL7547512.1 cytochrome P450 [Frankia sp. AgB1.9]MBL7619023.1 cytochrome P450 [Frankia sp. AgB1.8]